MINFPPLIEYALNKGKQIKALVQELLKCWQERKHFLQKQLSHGVPWVIVEFIFWHIAAINNWNFSNINDIKQEFDNLLHKYQQVLKHSLSEKYRITCLSECYDSILMWSHYANKHIGFCLEYDFTQIDYSDDVALLLLDLFPVLYSNERVNPPEDFIQQTKFRYYSNNQKLKRDSNFLLGMLTKSKVWKYEKEWRFICLKEALITMKMPYVSKVFLGVNMPSEIKMKLLRLAKDKNLPVYQMYMDSNSFQLKSVLL